MIDIPDSIFPLDEQGNSLCPKCRKTLANCDCPSLQPKPTKLIKISPKIRLDKSGRKGKVVTLIDNLPAKDEYLKNLAKKLKTKTGSGGTYYIEDGQGVIEVQGDHRKILGEYLVFSIHWDLY